MLWIVNEGAACDVTIAGGHAAPLSACQVVLRAAEAPAAALPGWRAAPRFRTDGAGGFFPGVAPDCLRI
jgi:hypothetical protein